MSINIVIDGRRGEVDFKDINKDYSTFPEVDSEIDIIEVYYQV